METGGIQLTPALIEAFGGAFLSPSFDNLASTAPFHRECWALYCSDEPLVAVAAPRGHAKSTALTHTFGLSAACWRWEPHIMIVSATEELAMSQLGDMAKELRENEDLRGEFGVEKFVTDTKSEIVVRCDDGYEFRVIARGADQRVRGIKWRGRRPGLILLDDVEEDEQVLNADRRKKFGNWVRRALIPMGRKGCRVRWHGTILHQHAMLARLMKSSSWKTRRYKAHRSFDDFSEVLWPAMWDGASLRAKRQMFIDDGDSAGYAQEYLNDPRDDSEAYLKPEQFLPMEDSDHYAPSMRVVGVDFAISKQDKANRTAFVVVGARADNLLNFQDVKVGRMDSDEIIESFFDLQAAWRPDVFFVESGQIWLAIKPTLTKEMLRRGIFLNYQELTPIKDKAARGRAWQKRMKVRACRFDKSASWYPGFEEECLNFTGYAEAELDDQFDAAATAVLGLESMADLEEEDFMTEEEMAWERESRRHERLHHDGRSQVTGY